MTAPVRRKTARERERRPHITEAQLHAAGLLAGEVDRERLAHRLATWRFTNGAPGGEPVYPPAPIDYEEADAILREIGGGK